MVLLWIVEICRHLTPAEEEAVAVACPQLRKLCTAFACGGGLADNPLLDNNAAISLDAHKPHIIRVVRKGRPHPIRPDPHNRKPICTGHDVADPTADRLAPDVAERGQRDGAYLTILDVRTVGHPILVCVRSIAGLLGIRRVGAFTPGIRGAQRTQLIEVRVVHHSTCFCVTVHTGPVISCTRNKRSGGNIEHTHRIRHVATPPSTGPRNVPILGRDVCNVPEISASLHFVKPFAISVMTVFRECAEATHLGRKVGRYLREFEVQLPIPIHMLRAKDHYCITLPPCNPTTLHATGQFNLRRQLCLTINKGDLIDIARGRLKILGILHPMNKHRILISPISERYHFNWLSITHILRTHRS